MTTEENKTNQKPQPAAPVLRSKEDSSSLEKIQEVNQDFKERELRSQAKGKGMKAIDLRNAPLNQDALQLMPWKEVKEKQCIPFDVNGKILHVACVDHESEAAKATVANFIEQGYQPELYLCSAEGIASAERFYKNFLSQEKVEVKEEVVEDSPIQDVAEVKKLFEEHAETFEKGTGPDMANVANLQAIKFRASDVHYQPEEEEVVVRMRRDGKLYEVFRLSHKQYLLLSGEVKRTGGLKMNVRNVPQDGDYEFMVNKRKISVRVSTLPSKFGESMVLRILDAEHAIVDLSSLGFSKKGEELVSTKSQKDRGLILVTGPTGSGKTSTLYSVLHAINTPDKKIITLEDPIEFELKNTIQSQIKEEEEFTFASGLRAILRQDPDVIMVGEIRDKEPAEIALQASLTGHLVLSTLHSNDAVATIPRMLNMGIKPYILAAGLELVVAQRLVRKICQDCKQPAEMNESAKKEIDEVVASLQEKGYEVPEQQLYASKGCDSCANTGYQGRLAVSEVLPITESLRQAILAGEPEKDMLAKAEAEGFLRMKEDGILKALNGETTLEEVWKVLI